MDASVLLKIEDVTEPVKAAGTTLALRNAAIARIEKECAAKSGNVCSVVRLFSGGRYDLYQYRRYSDLRLVFAPEYAIAFFGRERDSISYLRYGLNIAFLRAYENGKPAATPDYLKWSAEGVKEGDLVFLGGNPGPTGRLSTASQLTFLRDTALPLRLTRLQPRVVQLNAFAAASEDNLRAAQSTLSRLLTEYKTDAGKLIGLRDDRMVTRKTAFEGKIRRAVEGNAKLGAEAGKVWDEITNAYRKWKPLRQVVRDSGRLARPRFAPLPHGPPDRPRGTARRFRRRRQRNHRDHDAHPVPDRIGRPWARRSCRSSRSWPAPLPRRRRKKW